MDIQTPNYASGIKEMKLFDSVENKFGKAENADFFVEKRNPQMISKSHFLKVIKKVGLVGCLTHYQTTNFRLFQIERLCRQQFRI